MPLFYVLVPADLRVSLSVERRGTTSLYITTMTGVLVSNDTVA